MHRVPHLSNVQNEALTSTPFFHFNLCCFLNKKNKFKSIINVNKKTSEQKQISEQNKSVSKNASFDKNFEIYFNLFFNALAQSTFSRKDL